MARPPRVRRTSVLRSKTLAQGRIYFARASSIIKGSSAKTAGFCGEKGGSKNHAEKNTHAPMPWLPGDEAQA